MDFSAGELSPKATQILDAALDLHRAGRSDQDDARRRRPRGRLCAGHRLPLLRRTSSSCSPRSSRVRPTRCATRSSSTRPRRARRSATRSPPVVTTAVDFLAHAPGAHVRVRARARGPAPVPRVRARRRGAAHRGRARRAGVHALPRRRRRRRGSASGSRASRSRISSVRPRTSTSPTPQHVRALVDDFVVPGFVNSEGVSR